MNNAAAIQRLARWFFSAAFLIQFYYFFNNAMFSSLLAPVLVYPSADVTYWLLLHFKIPQLLTQTAFFPALTDVLLFSVIVAAQFFTDRRFWAMGYTVLIALYITTFGIYSGHHFHGLVMLLFGSVPFWFKNEKRFWLMAEAARYYFLFIFVSAFLWKLTRGGLFYPHQMVNILKAQHASFLFSHPYGPEAAFLRILISHPLPAQVLLWAAALLQCTFLIGFFTKKWDGALFYLAILFCIFNLLVMRIPSFEILVGLIFLRIDPLRESAAPAEVSLFPPSIPQKSRQPFI